MSWDHSATFDSSGTWTFPQGGVRENKLFVTGCGKGGNGGNHYQGSYPVYDWVTVWHPAEYGYVQVWVPDQWGFDSQTMTYTIIVPGHYESQYGVVRDAYTTTEYQYIRTNYYTNGGGGGEAGEYKEQTITIGDTSPISVTISASVSFGSYLSCSGGANGGNAGDGTNYGAGGSGGQGADGSSGSRSAGGQGGSSGISGYGSGGTGGFNGSPSVGQGGFVTVSWNDGSYAYVMEGE